MLTGSDAGVIGVDVGPDCSDVNSSRNPDWLLPPISVFATTNDNNAHNMKNIVANIAVIFVKKLPAADPVNTPPNIDAALDPDMPEPSDFCNKIKPVIKTATMINNTNNIENIFLSFDLYCDCNNP